MRTIFFDSWSSLARSFIIPILAYVVIVIMLRVSGKRTLAKMNAFDFIVTVALGSCLASVSLNKNVALADGCLVFLLLIALQYAITWLSVRVPFIKNLVSSQPTLLLYNGQLLQKELKQQRITIEAIYVAVRAKGIASLEEVDVIVLETTGDIMVVPKMDLNNPQTLTDIKNYKPKVY